jgi:hypothetical protein
MVFRGEAKAYTPFRDRRQDGLAPNVLWNWESLRVAIVTWLFLRQWLGRRNSISGAESAGVVHQSYT